MSPTNHRTRLIAIFYIILHDNFGFGDNTFGFYVTANGTDDCYFMLDWFAILQNMKKMKQTWE